MKALLKRLVGTRFHVSVLLSTKNSEVLLIRSRGWNLKSQGLNATVEMADPGQLTSSFDASPA